jgi:hypothetical protein
MNSSEVGVSGKQGRFLNAVPLKNAVLCAECDVVSDSPHDVCMVCGSRSLFSIARVFGGQLPTHRTSLMVRSSVQSTSEKVLLFPKPHRVRRRATAGLRQLPLVSLDEHEPDALKAEMHAGTKAR